MCLKNVGVRCMRGQSRCGVDAQTLLVLCCPREGGEDCGLEATGSCCGSEGCVTMRIRNDVRC